MPEPPDFDAIAERLGRTVGAIHESRQPIVEQLRLIWNARGAVDIATLEEILPTLTTVKPGAMKTIDAALRDQDR